MEIFSLGLLSHSLPKKVFPQSLQINMVLSNVGVNIGVLLVGEGIGFV